MKQNQVHKLQQWMIEQNFSLYVCVICPINLLYVHALDHCLCAHCLPTHYLFRRCFIASKIALLQFRSSSLKRWPISPTNEELGKFVKSRKAIIFDRHEQAQGINDMGILDFIKEILSQFQRFSRGLLKKKSLYAIKAVCRKNAF